VRDQPLSSLKACGGVAGRRVTTESNLSDIAENAASIAYPRPALGARGAAIPNPTGLHGREAERGMTNRAGPRGRAALNSATGIMLDGYTTSHHLPRPTADRRIEHRWS